MTGAGGVAKATFEALVAWDPAFPSHKVKGLRILLSEGAGEDEWTDTVYLDDDRDERFGRDSLKEFQDDLAFVAALKGEAQGPYPAMQGSSASADNRTTPERYVPRNGEINIGWYHDGKQFGVDVGTYWHFGPAAQCRWQCGEVGLPTVASDWHDWLYFPGEDLAHVVDMVARGRAFLAAQ
jgi:hypothetical protein